MKLFNGLKKIYSDDLIGTSTIIFLSSVMINALNLIFWFYMVRRLSPIDYANLNSLFSLMMILSLPTGSTYTVIIKFIAQFHSQGDYSKIRFFLFHLGKRILILGGILLFLFILFSPKIALFMNIPSAALVIITGLGLFFSILNPIPAGILGGLQLFLAMSVIGIIAGIIKLICSVGLVVLGFGSLGAMIGVVLSVIFGLAIVSARAIKELPIYRVKEGNDPVVDFNSVYSYFIPVSVGIFCFMVLTNIDIILVKHYFSPLEAGYYSIAQMVGKIILFLPAAIGVVIFPKLTNSYAQKKNTTNLLKKSLTLVGVLCSLAAIISILFPQLILRILTGKVALECIPLARLFALAMTFFALTQILMTYHLSVHNFKFIFLMAFFTALQVILIILFHQQLVHILYILLFISVLSFAAGLKMANFKNK